MFKLIDKTTYSTRQENTDFFIGISADKNLILTENMENCSENYFLLFEPLERYCKSAIIFDKKEPNLKNVIRLINEDKVIYYNLEENNIFLKVNEEGKIDVYTDKSWGIDKTTEDYIISYCTYLSEEENEDYLVYTEDIIQYTNTEGKIKVGKVKLINNEFVTVDKDNIVIDVIRNNKDIFATEISILNKDSVAGEYWE